MRTERCDVLVVGAGPAGSTAARVAAREGARVLLVERRSQIGVPEQCAGYVAQAIRRHIDLPRECVAQAISRLRTWLPDGTSHLVEMPGYLLNRASLDRYLALQAVKAGARLLLRATFKGFEEPASERRAQTGGSPGPQPVTDDPSAEATASGLRVGARHASPAQAGPDSQLWAAGRRRFEPLEAVLMSEGQEVLVKAGVVVGADGPRSSVARSIGLAPGALARAVQYEVVLGRTMEEAEVYFGPLFPGGYAWLFPAGATARVGAAFTSGAEAALEGLAQLRRNLEDQGRITGSAISYSAGPVPVGGPMPGRHGNVLLAGDAAGHTHPITGAGILNGIIAGELAGRAAARAALSGDSSVLDEYEEEFQIVLGPALERAREKREGLDRAWRSAPEGLSKSIRESWIAFDEYYSR